VEASVPFFTNWDAKIQREKALSIAEVPS